MKILLSGMNGNQCTRKFYLRQQLKVVPSHYSLWNCLTAMGYTVEQRKVELGEDLSGYDEVIVFLAGPRQLVAGNVYNGLWAISQRPDCIIGLDDWQAADLYKGIEKCASEKELFAKFILDTNKTSVEALTPYKAELQAAISTIMEKKNRLLISAFSTAHLNSRDYEDFGPQLLFPAYPRDRLFTYNPNPFHRNRTWGNSHHEGAEDPTWTPPILDYTSCHPPVKERRFNFASLVQSRTKKWLKLQGYKPGANDEEGRIGDWVVDLYGSKKDSQKRLTEDQMVMTFARDWGCLMPGYDHAGSGWWRAKPKQLADTGSILIGEDEELLVLYGERYPYLGLKAIDLVTATDDELKLIAGMQVNCLNQTHPLYQEVQKKELQAVLGAPK